MTTASTKEDRKPVRVWVDGCFDMVHFGHANAMRQARSLGDYLIVGVHSDAEIEHHKGPPVFTQEERYAMVRAIKWVDEVVESAPYITSIETLEKYNCDFCAHGDDITTSADGVDTYQLVKDAGKYKEFKRTEGVSTTNLVHRMLQTNHKRLTARDSDSQLATSAKEVAAAASPYTTSCEFVPTTQWVTNFASNRLPQPGEKVAYVCGAFDLFHVGHIKFLEKCHDYAPYLIVGVHSDATVAQYRGDHYPIQTMHERVLSVLACRYVANVVMDAPLRVTERIIKHLKVDVVLHGTRTVIAKCSDGSDPYGEAKRLGLYEELNSESGLTTCCVIERIAENSDKFIDRNEKKEKKELAKMAPK